MVKRTTRDSETESQPRLDSFVKPPLGVRLSLSDRLFDFQKFTDAKGQDIGSQKNDTRMPRLGNMMAQYLVQHAILLHTLRGPDILASCSSGFQAWDRGLVGFLKLGNPNP